MSNLLLPLERPVFIGFCFRLLVCVSIVSLLISFLRLHWKWQYVTFATFSVSSQTVKVPNPVDDRFYVFSVLCLRYMPFPLCRGGGGGGGVRMHAPF